MAESLERLAEKAFETQFSTILPPATVPIYLPKAAIDNSPFMKRIYEKYKKNTNIVLVANGNASENGENKAETKTN